jgi:hypothetical protein
MELFIATVGDVYALVRWCSNQHLSVDLFSPIARLKKDLEAVLLLNGNAVAADFSRPSSNRLAPR